MQLSRAKRMVLVAVRSDRHLYGAVLLSSYSPLALLQYNHNRAGCKEEKHEIDTAYHLDHGEPVAGPLRYDTGK